MSVNVNLWIGIGLFVVWSVVYVIIRPYLIEWPTLKPIYEKIFTLENWLWGHSRTILLARLVTLVSLLVELHDVALPILAGVDWTPLLTPEQQKLVPIVGIVLGILFEWMRRLTNKSLTERSADYAEPLER